MEGILIPAEIGGIRTLKDGTVSLNLETREISPDKAGAIFSLRNKAAYCYISAKQVSKSEAGLIDGLEPEFQGKSPSKRLHGVMWLNWKQSNEGYEDFNLYYLKKMEAIIETYKSNLV